MPIITTDDSEFPKITIPFPEEKYGVYLKRFPMEIKDKPTTQQKKHIFITMIFDYKKGEISLDEFSSTADFLYNSLTSEEKNINEFADALLAAAELNYYVRQIKEDIESGRGFIVEMNHVMKYFNKNKSLVLK